MNEAARSREKAKRELVKEMVEIAGRTSTSAGPFFPTAWQRSSSFIFTVTSVPTRVCG